MGCLGGMDDGQASRGLRGAGRGDCTGKGGLLLRGGGKSHGGYKCNTVGVVVSYEGFGG